MIERYIFTLSSEKGRFSAYCALKVQSHEVVEVSKKELANRV